jgi:predicted DNA binding protein
VASEPPFHLLLEEDEVRAVRTALNLLIADERHERPIRPLAREVVASLEAAADEAGILSVPLTPEQMKITHTAVKLGFDDTRREQVQEREALRRVLEKLPDEHTMRAIRLD